MMSMIGLELHSQNKIIEAIPPTADALVLHTKRAIYQSGVWARCLQPMQHLPSPSNFRWAQEDGVNRRWIPVWMTQPEASMAVRELVVVCKCKPIGKEGSKCRCKGANMDCKCTKHAAYNKEVFD